MSVHSDRPLSASLPSPAQPAYRIELSLSVADAGALWSAALDRALAQPGADYEDVIEVIGPSEDPDLAACLAMLTAPAGIPGCRLEDFEVAEWHSVPAQAAANDMATLKRAGASR